MSMDPQRLQTLIDAHFEGRLSAAERVELEALLAENDEACLQFWREAEWNADIRTAAEALAARQEQQDHAPAAAEILGWLNLRIAFPALAIFVRHARVFSWATAAVVVCIAVGVMALMFLPKPRDQARQNDVAQSHESGEQKTAFAARLTRLQEAEWVVPTEGGEAADMVHYRRPETLQPQAELVAGDQLYLKSGLAEINFARGAVIVLEGPAHFRIDGGNHCGLDQGKLVARVETREAKGFAVRTPTSLITDLGTEFGVAVRERETSLTVIRGAVTAQSRTVLRDGLETLGQPTRVVAGQGAAVDKVGRLLLDAPDEKMFASTRVSPGLDFRIIPIENPSFELPTLASGEPWRNKITGWQSAGDGSGVCNFGREFKHGTRDGAQHLFLNTGEVRQVLREKLAPETLYRLTIWVGNRPGENSPNFDVELLAGQAVLARVTNEPKPPKGRFGQVMLEYRSGKQDASLGQPLTIVLRSHGGLGTKTQNHFDVVRLEAHALDSSAPVKKSP